MTSSFSMSDKENICFPVDIPKVQWEACQSAEDWLAAIASKQARLYDATATSRFDQLTHIYFQAFQWLKQNAKDLSTNEAYAQLLLNYASLVSCSHGVAEGRKWFLIAIKEASLVPNVYQLAAEFEVSHGEVESAKQILKRALELKVLSVDKVNSLISTLIVDHLGNAKSVDNFGSTNRGHQQSHGVNRRVLADVTPLATSIRRQGLPNITPRTVGTAGGFPASASSSSSSSATVNSHSVGVMGKARRVPVHSIPPCQYDSDDCDSSMQPDYKNPALAEDSFSMMDCSVGGVTSNCRSATDNNTWGMNSLSINASRSQAADHSSQNDNGLVAGTLRQPLPSVGAGISTQQSLSHPFPDRRVSASGAMGNSELDRGARSFSNTRSLSATAMPTEALPSVEPLRSTRANSSECARSSIPAMSDTTNSDGLNHVQCENGVTDSHRVSCSAVNTKTNCTATSQPPVKQFTTRAMRVPRTAHSETNDDSDSDEQTGMEHSPLAVQNFPSGDLSAVVEQSQVEASCISFTTDCFSVPLPVASMQNSVMAPPSVMSGHPPENISVRPVVSSTMRSVVPSVAAAVATTNCNASASMHSLNVTLPANERPSAIGSSGLHTGHSEVRVSTGAAIPGAFGTIPVMSSTTPVAQPVTDTGVRETEVSGMRDRVQRPCSSPNLLPHLKDCKILQVNDRPYMLLNVIGRGGSSKVFEALGPDRKICAIKTVNLDTADESMVAGYRNEINLLQRLQSCDEIVKLVDHMFDEIHSMLYVVMERGEMDLATFFRSNKMRPNIARHLIKPFWMQMLYAVQALHQHGIVHSDLKPANFILVGGVMKLIDFGIAKAIQPDRTSITCDQIVGTFNYMSPEAVIDLNGGIDPTGQSKPNIKISTKSDVWSLGCILYYLVYNKTPFESIRMPVLKLQAIVNPNHEISFPATDLTETVAVLRKCLDRNQRSRPSVDDLLNHPYVTGQPMPSI